MQRIIRSSFLPALATLLITATGCNKEFDSPPVRTIPEGGALTIAQLKALYQGVPVHFAAEDNQNLYAVVTADEQNGNLYKNIYIQDHTGAMAIRLLNSGGLYQGDSIRIYLPGTVLSPYNGLMQIDSVSVDDNVVKQATGVQIAPRPTTISELTNTNFGLQGPYQSMLIKLSGVQFADAELGQTYADPVGQQTINRVLVNCAGQSTIVRNSGYANFAGDPIPEGRGDFTGIASWFGSAAQLYIRDINEVQLNGPRCGESGCEPVNALSEDFSGVANNEAVDLECWTNVFTEGNFAWRGRVIGEEKSAEARRPSFDPISTMWLITPTVIHADGMHLSFKTAHNGWHSDALSVWASTDFSGSVGTATWTPVSGVQLAGEQDDAGAWVASGSISMSDALPEGYVGNFVVAFKYSDDTAIPTTFRLDEVVIE